MITVRFVCLFFIGATLTGCATAPQSLYSWGSYQQSVYRSMVKPTTTSAQAEIDQMEKDRRTLHGRLPPGWHAHLGSLYAEIGNTNAAKSELLAEKASFPESSVFVDNLLKQLVKTSGEANESSTAK